MLSISKRQRNEWNAFSNLSFLEKPKQKILGTLIARAKNSIKIILEMRNNIKFSCKVEYHMFVEEFKRKPGTIWIMKPAGRAQGKGIFLFTELKDITDWKKVSNSSFNFK